jgi:2-polyprenyl-6-methoxyphenol hydroxylase-like FAD-dependent oxidoreductase
MTPSPANHRHIVVVGAGPVGLALTYGLASAGVQVTLIERDPAVSRQLRASTFHPPTLDMLDAWGITDELLRRGRITPRWQIRLHETGEHVSFDLSVLGDETAHPYRLQCEQSVLSEALEARLRQMSGVRILRGRTVRAVGQDAGGAWVEVTAAGEAGGAATSDAPASPDAERIEAAYVVGCDGAHSLVRKTIGAEFEGTIYPDVTLLATTGFDFGSMWEDLDGVNYIWQESGTYSLLHLPSIWRVSLHPTSDAPLEIEADPARIEARLRELFPGHGPFPLVEIRPYRVHKRLATRWRDRRLLIAGDAAHLNNPKGGMGMNGGIHDAMCLCEHLVRALDGAPPQDLDGYERQRLPVIRDDIIGQADRNHARMQIRDLAERRAALARLQAVIDDPDRCRAYLRQTSMLEGLDKARALARGEATA